MIEKSLSRRMLMIGTAATSVAMPYIARAETGISRGDVTLGMWSPLTGPTALLGTSERDAIQIAIDEVNAADGVNGKQLKLIVYDDNGSPQQAMGAVRKLIDSDGVFALIAGSISGATLPVMPLIERASIPFVASISSNDALITPAAKTVFRVYANDTVQATNLVNYAIATNFKKPAIIYTSNDYGIGGEKIVRQLTASHQTPLVAAELYNEGDQDFTPQLLRIREAGADALFVWAFAAEAGIIARQAKQLGLNVPMFGGGGSGTPLFLKAAGASGVGFVASFVCPDLPETSTQPVITKYRQALSRRYNGNVPAGRPSEYDLAGYGALKIFAEALRRAGHAPSRGNLVEALQSLKNFDTGTLFPVTFSASQHEGTNRCAIIRVNAAQAWEVVA